MIGGLRLPARVDDQAAVPPANLKSPRLDAQSRDFAFLEDVLEPREVIHAPHEPRDGGLARVAVFPAAARVTAFPPPAASTLQTDGDPRGSNAASRAHDPPVLGECHGRRGAGFRHGGVRSRLARLLHDVEGYAEARPPVGPDQKATLPRLSPAAVSLDISTFRGEHRHGHEIVPSEGGVIPARGVRGEASVGVPVHAPPRVVGVDHRHSEEQPAAPLVVHHPGRGIASHLTRASRGGARGGLIALFALQAHGQALRAVHLRLVHAQSKVAVASREARRHHLLRLDHLAKLGEVVHFPRELSGEYLAVVGILGGERDGVLDVRRLSRGCVARGEVVAGELASLAEHGDPRGDLQGAVHEQSSLG